MKYNRLHHNCGRCTDAKKRKLYGCIRPTSKKKPVWQIDYCYKCGGNDERCVLCRGTNRINVHRCHVKLAGEISRHIPAFDHYIKFGIFPNGKPFTKQPIKLLQALRVYQMYLNMYEADQLERLSKGK